VVNKEDLRSVVGATAYDRDGDKIGKIGAVYYDDNTEQPKWLSVNTGFFGMSESFVPLQGADVTGDGVRVGYDKATVKDAPNVDAEGHLSVEEEQRLYQHYSLDYGTGHTERTGYERESGYQGTTGYQETSGYEQTSGRDRTVGDERTAGYEQTTGYDETARGRHAEHATSGDSAMTRSEEQLRVGTETREAGRARLRKHVVTEHEQVSVPVSREEVTLEREPITESNRGSALSGADITEDEHEVVLREERPVVDKEAVPVERVRLGTETHTDQETVGGEVRKERIEFDDETETRRR
jgi:uncharacterized protein (TIGR02271 family)